MDKDLTPAFSLLEFANPMTRMKHPFKISLTEDAKIIGLQNQMFWSRVIEDKAYIRVLGSTKSDTVAKIAPNQLAIVNNQHFDKLPDGEIEVYRDENVVVTNVGSSNMFWRPRNIVRSPSRLKVVFDDGSNHRFSMSDMTHLYVPIMYDGPTVNNLPPPAPVEEESSKLPLDRFCRHIKIGDMFLAATSGELIIGRLIRVSIKGVITYSDMLTGAIGRLSSESTKTNIIQTLPDMSLLRFENNEVLSRTITLQKLCTPI